MEHEELEYRIFVNEEPKLLSPSSPMSDAHFLFEKPSFETSEFKPLDEKLNHISINPMFSTKEKRVS